MSLLIASFPETKHIGKKVAKVLKAKHTTIFVEDFPDSEFHLKLRKNPKNKTVVIINSITKDPDEKIIETILAAGVAKDFGAKKVVLVATYFPYMRQDKHFLKYDSFSSRHIIKLFSDFNDIFLLDPHLHRIKAPKELYWKAKRISANKLIANFIAKKFKGDFIILGPDEESTQWSSEIAKILGKNVVILKKIRKSPRFVKINKVNLGIAKNVIIIDDIISTGRTLVETLKIAKEQGAKNLVCIGIHGIFAEGADKKIRKYARLITTNSIPNKYAKIDVSSVISDALKNYS
ncbi:MAG: ribose-phosphate diphosphokinase [Nanoarchaeota archaeon]